jgi:hypothetical protein
MDEVCVAPTCHVLNVRPSIDSPHQGLVLRPTPEYQCLWIQFYRASIFYCMATSPDSLLPSGLPSAADWATIGVATASKSSVTATATIASAAITVVITNKDNHLCNGHGVDDCLHDGYDNVIVDNGSPLLPFLLNNHEGNGFPTRHASSNADADATIRRHCRRRHHRWTWFDPSWSSL